MIFTCQVEDGSDLFCFIHEKRKKVIPLLFFLSQTYFILKLDVYPWAGFYVEKSIELSHMPIL